LRRAIRHSRSSMALREHKTIFSMPDEIVNRDNRRSGRVCALWQRDFGNWGRLSR
jgi:hypothetical protein